MDQPFNEDMIVYFKIIFNNFIIINMNYYRVYDLWWLMLKKWLINWLIVQWIGFRMSSDDAENGCHNNEEIPNVIYVQEVPKERSSKQLIYSRSSKEDPGGQRH